MRDNVETDGDLLADIAARIARIEVHTKGDPGAIETSITVEDAVARSLQTLAESTARLSQAIKDTEPNIPWDQIRGFRNVLAHDYQNLELPAIRDVLENDIAPLQAAVKRMADRVARQLEDAARRTPSHPSGGGKGRPGP